MEDNKKLTITFVVPSLNLTGGIRVISIYASYLADSGHNVYVVSPSRKIHPIKKRIKSLITGHGWSAGSHFSDAYFTNPNVKLKILDSWRDVTTNDVPDADVVIATFWNTAEWVNLFPESKGKKLYFIQHHEVHPWMPIDRVKQTLKMPFKKLVVAEWLKNIMASEYDDFDVKVIPNGVDHSQFYSGQREKNQIPTVGFFYSEREFKGTDTILEAINFARKSCPNIQVIAMGMKAPIKKYPLPNNTKYIQAPPQEDIRRIYESCDVWLFGSRSEGFGLTLLESMSCKTPVIATRAGAAEELVGRSKGILVDIDDYRSMASAIIEIANMAQSDWLKLSNLAYTTSLDYTWGNSAEMFEKELQKIAFS
ncbi:glycosyltransferase family 4 protein [Methylophaga thalassica]|uniref:glycosyltransferase family 4 protein n=1 Tax=Methylophaga thalassica TaxID=40223 RepID=UPI002E7C334C|nr:glycosyltransferase family 4 protein [Methylophaga thalassica]WVI84741.1 glycosyltransferase family 4 protein [Methylophaga thalassica]